MLLPHLDTNKKHFNCKCMNKFNLLKHCISEKVDFFQQRFICIHPFLQVKLLLHWQIIQQASIRLPTLPYAALFLKKTCDQGSLSLPKETPPGVYSAVVNEPSTGEYALYRLMIISPAVGRKKQ